MLAEPVAGAHEGEGEGLAAHEHTPFKLRDAGIAPELLHQPAARITERQFATLYRLLAIQSDDEMPRMFSRPVRPGALKFTCLSLLEARDLFTALHRWSIFLRMLQDDFQFEVSRDGPVAKIVLVQEPGRPPIKPIALDLILKLVHGVTSWLIAAIAAQLGFDGPASFHRAFKGWTGSTPGAYRSVAPRRVG